MIQVTFSDDLLARGRVWRLTRRMFNDAGASGLAGAMNKYAALGGSVNYAQLLTDTGCTFGSCDHTIRESPVLKAEWFRDRYGIIL